MALVKICGLKSAKAASHALDSGADLTGIILVPNRARTVEVAEAAEISRVVRARRAAFSREFPNSNVLWQHLQSLDLNEESWSAHVAETLKQNGPFLVGVFRNQSLDEINSMVDQIGLDFVQLHGSEDPEVYIPGIKVPVIRRITVDQPIEVLLAEVNSKKHLLALLDSELGGEGKTVDWGRAHLLGETGGRYLLAGGLTPDNVGEALKNSGTLGVDVSGGVETNGTKDFDKIAMFVKNAKSG
ncbi:unnamed protein product [Kuraishia capsulata CBS 1993]|uniref:N-(5'-phosphoribosyl)anthranilate isomerase n=1 Tax=Kuraishia capsulata CBS 1993 TaxID=1382522 RepID=W6MPZ5_9ASCO|nr:uncharacterized protein KUCA_T00003270001 [Kuraishia capsulata CBS 1993]CDK27292.1 unnamed protein product [Kuraishia capsulata CBS 1993]